MNISSAIDGQLGHTEAPYSNKQRRTAEIKVGDVFLGFRLQWRRIRRVGLVDFHVAIVFVCRMKGLFDVVLVPHDPAESVQTKMFLWKVSQSLPYPRRAAMSSLLSDAHRSSRLADVQKGELKSPIRSALLSALSVKKKTHTSKTEQPTWRTPTLRPLFSMGKSGLWSKRRPSSRNLSLVRWTSKSPKAGEK
jgi:hypothetical protein